MKEELQKKLYDKYPVIFGAKDLGPSKSCMFWGIEVGDGWFNIIDILCDGLMHHYKNELEHWQNRARMRSWAGRIENIKYHLHMMGHPFTKSQRKHLWHNLTHPGWVWYHIREHFISCWSRLEDKPEPVVAAQVKEKFGGLRFYTNGHDEFCSGLIDMAECMSECTCEVCGGPGKLITNGWWHCICPECEDRKNEGN